MKEGKMLRSIILSLGTLSIVFADACTKHAYGLRYYTIYCYYDCCGSLYDRYCCVPIDGGAIAGIVIGSLIGLALFVTLIVCLCSACNKSAGARGRVVQPTGAGANIAVVNTSVTTTPGHALYPQYGVPSAHYPPAGGSSHPPPGVAYHPHYPQGHELPYPPPYSASINTMK